MRMYVRFFLLPRLSNPVHTNPTTGDAEVERCFEARYAGPSVEQTPLGSEHDLSYRDMGGKETQRTLQGTGGDGTVWADAS